MENKDRLGVEVLILVVAWAMLANRVGAAPFPSPRTVFSSLLMMVALILIAPSLATLVRGRTVHLGPLLLRLRCGAARPLLRWLAVPILIGGVLGFGWFQLHAFSDQIRAPRNKARLVDIGQNTYEASKLLFSKGVNPYATRTQIWNDVHGKGIKVIGRQTYMFGVPYKYGYPYYPWMLVSYEGFRRLVGTYNAMRVANLIFLLASVAAMALIARQLAPRDWRLAALAMVAAFVSAKKMGPELFNLGITDIVIPCYLLFGFLAMLHRRDLLAGLLFGMAQACKLFPGVLVSSLAFFWYRDRRRRWRFFLACAGLTALSIGPFLVWDPEAFVSATLLYYLTFHGEGDQSSYHNLLPRAWKQPFQIARWVLIGAVALFGLRRSREEVARLVMVSAVCYLIFVAFNKMIHLNYILSIHSVSSVALILQATGGLQPSRSAGSMAIASAACDRPAPAGS